MKANLVRIGNSRGIRIPKPLIDQCGLGETVDIRVERGSLIISPAKEPRQGWKEAFKTAAGSDREMLLEGIPGNDFDCNEWQW